MTLMNLMVGDIVKHKESSGNIIVGIVTKLWKDNEHIDILRDNGFVMTITHSEAKGYLTIIGHEPDSLNSFLKVLQRYNDDKDD